MAFVYMRKPSSTDDPVRLLVLGDRPWRRVGAAICVVLSVMFVLGINFPRPVENKIAFLVFWMLILFLLLWLCVLVIKDLLYTRKRLMELKDKLRELNVASAFHTADDEENVE